MDKVAKNLSDIERKVGKANKILAKGTGIKLGDAIKLGQKSNSVVSTIRKGIKEYDGTDPTAEETRQTLDKMNVIVTLTETQLELLMQNKPNFDKLHVGGLVRRNIEKSQEASLELSKVMLEKAPVDVKPEADALEQRRKVAFEKAISFYLGATGGEDHAVGEDESD
ncbi:hypothetical protein TWF281_003787 [Arthrobotrys megalospora]